MKTCTFNISDISKFITARNIPYSFATICSKDFSDFCLNEEQGLFLRIQNYDENIYNKIVDQTKNWEIKIVRSEDWDPSIYDIGRTVKEETQKINPKIILVKDEMFIGVIDCADSGEHYSLSYVLIEDYDREPLLFGSTSGFGSSDHDMMYTINFYLQKKD